MRLIALKDLSLVADDTGIVSKIQMMLYIAGISHGLLNVVCRVISGLSSARAHIHKIYFPW